MNGLVRVWMSETHLERRSTCVALDVDAADLVMGLQNIKGRE